MSPAPTLGQTPGRTGASGASGGTGPAALPTVPGPRARVLTTAAAVVALAVHLWGLYRDHGPPEVRWFPHVDKLEHLVGFALPCFLVLLALDVRARLAGRDLPRRTLALVGGLFSLHAGVSEVLQGALYTTRSGDPADAAADLVGTALGLLTFVLLLRARRGGGVRRRAGTT